MSPRNILIPINDVLDLLQIIDYDEDSTFGKLILLIESDLNNDIKGTTSLKVLDYFMLHKKECKSTLFIFEKCLKCCLNFLHFTTGKDVLINSIIGSIIETCLSTLDVEFANKIFELLLNFINSQHKLCMNASELSEINDNLLKIFLVLEKLCNLKMFLANTVNFNMELIPKIIVNEITNSLSQFPLESSKKLLVSMLPKFIAAQDSNMFLGELWAQIENLEDSLDKQLFYLCLLSDNFISLSPSSSSHPLYDKPTFWTILQNGLISDINLNRKLSLHLLKQYVFLFHESEMNFVGEYFLWNQNFKTNLFDFWNQSFVLFETLEEKQIHLITPALKPLPDLLLLCENSLKKCYKWLLCVFQRIISHTSFTLVKWGLQEFCKLNPNLLFSDNKCSILLHSFFKSMNNMFLYNVNAPAENALQDSLADWFTAVSECDVNELAFEIVLKVLVNSLWSPIPLYFVTDSLSKVPSKCIFSLDCLNYIRKILLETLKTQSVFIRSAIQCRLLKCITQLCKDEIEMRIIINILGHFNGDESLLRGTGMWDNCVEWLKNLYNSQDVEFIDLCVNQIFNIDSPLISNHFCARSTVLLIDSGVLQFTDHFVSFLDKIFEQFEGCEKRIYASSLIQDKCLEFIMYLIKESNLSLQVSGRLEYKLIDHIKSNLHLLISYIEFRLKRGIIDSFEVVSLYDALLQSIFSYDTLIEKVDFLSLYETAFQELLRNGQSVFKESLALKIIYTIFHSISTLNLNKDIFKKPFEQYFVECIFNKRLFGKHYVSDLYDQNCRGKVMSEVMEKLWSILYVYLQSSCDSILTITDSFSINSLMDSALNAISEDGKQALVPIFKCFTLLLPQNQNISSGLDFIKSSWVVCFELRKSELFWLTITEWISMVYQEKIISRREYHELIYKYSKEIIEQGDELIGLVDILTIQLSNVNIPLELSSIITDGILFGSISRKDRRTEYEVCQYIIKQSEQNSTESFGKWRAIRNDKEVRIRCLKILLSTKDVQHRNKLITSVIDELLEYDSSLSKNAKRYFNDSLIHRKKHRILQALLILEDYLFNSNSDECEELSKRIFEWVFESLKGANQQPSVRYQLEWLFIRLCLHHSNFLIDFWMFFEKAGSERLGSMCSFISIAYHLAIILEDDNFLKLCFENIIPWCMSQNFNIRLYSQVVLSKIWDLSPEISQNFDFIKKNQWKTYYEQGNVLINAKKMQSDFYFNYFHPVHHFSLETIFWDLPRLSNISSDEWTKHEILKKYSNLLSDCTKFKIKGSLENCLSPTWISKVIGEADGEFEANSIQKKFIPWKGLLPEPEGEITITKSGVILVASLIDKAANLGGLARTCEIFAAKELVIPNMDITKDKEFLGLSMTAEKHLHITEVKSYNLQEYLKIMKKQGYVLIGLEQTTGSVSLATYNFPQDCVLLLGNEREGVPANLIPLLDYCVEIPQFGVLRSLNVHVSGALFLWEYSKQHLLATPR